MASLNEDFIYEVLEVTSEIPVGNVASYGQIARLIGRDKNSRLVGNALKRSGIYTHNYPCHRVVNSAGRLVSGWTEQESLLLEEGVTFKANGHVDMKKCQWEE